MDEIILKKKNKKFDKVGELQSIEKSFLRLYLEKKQPNSGIPVGLRKLRALDCDFPLL